MSRVRNVALARGENVYGKRIHGEFLFVDQFRRIFSSFFGDENEFAEAIDYSKNEDLRLFLFTVSLMIRPPSMTMDFRVLELRKKVGRGCNYFFLHLRTW